MAKVWKRREDGTAPEEAQVGDFVVTNGGTYKVGDKDFYHPQINTYNYKGEYANPDMQALTDAAAKPLNQPAAPTVPAAVRQNTTPGLGASANAALAEYFNASRRRSGAGAYPGSEWDARTRQLINQALGMDYTAYTQSNPYKALAARYARQGKQAMDETISQIAARTGGLASSYAGVAGQAQYNEYMQRLEDAARKQFAQDRADAIQNAGLSQQMGAEAYQRWQDEQRRRASEDETQIRMIQQMIGNEESDLGRQLNAGEIAYRRERDKLGDEERLEQRDYERGEKKRLEEKSDAEKADTTAKQDAATAKKEARDEVEALISVGMEPSADLIARSEYSPEMIAAMKAAKAQNDARKSSGGGGGGRRSSGYSDDVVNDVLNSIDPNSSELDIAIALQEAGVKSGMAKQYAKQYVQRRKDSVLDILWDMVDTQQDGNGRPISKGGVKSFVQEMVRDGIFDKKDADPLYSKIDTRWATSTSKKEKENRDRRAAAKKYGALGGGAR